ncbi:uncharacterized protein LOC141695778 [Apium graveolens]|uniref:uncharacterized protein LOC141695778 n=1 Tax=Apium graveolens TaxID=4045 RepID=UPI003D79656F
MPATSSITEKTLDDDPKKKELRQEWVKGIRRKANAKRLVSPTESETDQVQSTTSSQPTVSTKKPVEVKFYPEINFYGEPIIPKDEPIDWDSIPLTDLNIPVPTTKKNKRKRKIIGVKSNPLQHKVISKPKTKVNKDDQLFIYDIKEFSDLNLYLDELDEVSGIVVNTKLLKRLVFRYKGGSEITWPLYRILNESHIIMKNVLFATKNDFGFTKIAKTEVLNRINQIRQSWRNPNALPRVLTIPHTAAKEINEDNVPLVEETARMKKARLAGLDTRGKATEPIFLRKHKEPMGEASTEGAEGHNAPITAAAPAAAATGAFQPLWGFRRGDTVVGSTKHAWDWSYHSVTPKDFTDVVATPDLERIKLMGAQSLASSNAYFQGAVRQAESWKRASDKADNALRRQQKKYATLEKKLKRKEEELGESNAELVVLRAEKDKAIDNYLDSEEFAQSMRIRDDSVFPEFFRTGWDTALGTVNEACPDINPADYICPDDEALLQRFRTRVVVSDHVPQDPLLPPPESFSRPAEDDSSSSSETTETSSESGEDDDMDAEGTSAP